MDVDKGIRKNRSLTLGKGLYLRVGHKGLYTNVATAGGGFCGKICVPSWRFFGKVEDKSFGDLSLAQ